MPIAALRSLVPGLSRVGLLTLAVLVPSGLTATESRAVQLVPHLAVYELKLSKTRGNSQMAGVRGRILYDFSGSACEGFTLNFRQVSELDSGEGKVATSDLRSTTWEDATARKYRFNSQNFLNDELVDAVDGSAERTDAEIDVRLKKPQSKTFPLATAVVFPTEHMRRILVAAEAGQSLLEFPVYDGSETGEKFYQTLTVIGRRIEPGAGEVTDAAAQRSELSKLARWPVTISYFDKSKTKDQGEQTPVYTISFELYENGISRALVLDYNDFVISGDLASLDIKTAKPCP